MVPFLAKVKSFPEVHSGVNLAKVKSFLDVCSGADLAVTPVTQMQKPASLLGLSELEIGVTDSSFIITRGKGLRGNTLRYLGVTWRNGCGGRVDGGER